MILLAIATQAALAADTIEKSLPPGMPELTLAAEHGDVSVRYEPGASESRLYATPKRWAEGCELRFTGSASAARAEVVRVSDDRFGRCVTDLHLVLGGPTELHVELGRGDVHLEDLESATHLSLGKGRVELDQVGGPIDLDVRVGRVDGTVFSHSVRVDVDRGKVRLAELDGPVDVRVGFGSVLLEYAIAPTALVHAQVGVGRIRARLPYGAYIDSYNMEPGLGVLRSAIPHRNAANTELMGGTGIGNVTIETIVEHEAPVETALVDGD